MHFTLWPSLTASEGGYADVTWADFLAFVARPVGAADKKALEGWSPIRAAGNRRGAANVEAVSCIVLDDDASGLSTEQVAAVYAGAAGAVHTSFSHTPEAPKHRIVLRTSRDMTPAEYPRVWRFVRDAATARGQRLDEAPKDASRFWYAPGHREGAPYAWCELTGAPLDVDAILAAAPAPEPEKKAFETTAPLEVTRTYEEQSSRETTSGRRAPVAAMLGAAWPAKGRHEAQLALAGALRAEGWVEADAIEFLCAVCRAAGDEDRPKREATIRHTYERPSDAPITGWTRLKAFVDPVVVDAARAALGQNAEWNEQLHRRLAEAAATARAPGEHLPAGETVTLGRIEFEVGGYDAPLPPIDYLIDTLFVRGEVAMLVAHGNSLKTWLAFSAAHAVASGHPWLGRFAVKRGKAAIVDFESGRYEVLRRLKLLGVKSTDVGERLLRASYPPAQLTDPETWIGLAGHGLDLLVVDSFNAAAPDLDENDARAALMLQHAGRFAEHTGCTVVVIHHSRKGSGGDRREAVRGSTALFAACDRIFEFVDLEKPEEAEAVARGVVCSTMRSVKDGAGRAPGDVRVELSDQGLRYLETAEAPAAAQDRPKTEADNRDWLLRRLASAPNGLLKADVRNLLRGKTTDRLALLSELSAASVLVEYKADGGKQFVMLNPNAPR